jgi:hypothetical protein
MAWPKNAATLHRISIAFPPGASWDRLAGGEFAPPAIFVGT